MLILREALIVVQSLSDHWVPALGRNTQKTPRTVRDHPRAPTARLLNISAGAPSVQVRRLLYSRGGALLYLADITYIASMLKLDVSAPFREAEPFGEGGS